ncbi:MAG: threonine ammonia-lyase [Bacteroidota bacterium]|nr:threonine ammonia-lyase [Candidatus Kapabacteria bacterium]MDW8219696.1 threonine ammonia-lyase [Bacteroidota bacterium]
MATLSSGASFSTVHSSLSSSSDQEIPSDTLAESSVEESAYTSLSVSFKDIEAAREAIRRYIYETPCAFSERLSSMTGCKLHLKLENLQMTASYKERGSLNKILHLTEHERKAGVIAASAGNHAQGVAYAAQRNGIKATIVMPETTPLAKVRGTQEFNAEVILYGSGYDDAFGRAMELQQEHGYCFIHAFDDPLIIAGQGTVGLELLEQNPYLEAVIVPVGGGGLIAGIAVAMKEINPKIRLIGVEAEQVPSMKASLAQGTIVEVERASTIADGIAVAKVGRHTFPIVQRYVDEIVTVNEEEIANAIMILLEREKTLVEGSGAAGFAAVYNRKIPGLDGKRVAVVITGGNIDITILSKILERGLAKDGRLASLKVIVPDKPGSIAEIATIVAKHRANILNISHDRVFTAASLRETEVEFLLETKGHAHVQDIVHDIAARQYQVKLEKPS